MMSYHKNYTPTDQRFLTSRFAGVLLGTAVGDSLGLPAENLTPESIRRLWKGDWRMRLVFGRGMISDDTEHTLMVTQALLAHADNPVAFQSALGWKIRWWFACLPGGVGLATAKACVRLWLGFPTHKSAVRSAGSGSAMRSAIIGAYFAHDSDKRRTFVNASSRLTHKGWQAETAAMAVAEAAAMSISSHGLPDAANLFAELRKLSSESEWQEKISQLAAALTRQDSVNDFVRTLGLIGGVSGYSLHVVPVALYAWLRHPGDFRRALIAAVECGGDTDTVGAILGALFGASHGVDQVPRDWLDHIVEWPRTIGCMRKMAERLAEQTQSVRPLGAVAYFWPGIVLRNIVFLGVVLLHGIRRLLPPY